MDDQSVGVKNVSHYWSQLKNYKALNKQKLYETKFRTLSQSKILK